MLGVMAGQWSDDLQGGFHKLVGQFEAGVDYITEKSAWVAWVTRILPENTATGPIYQPEIGHGSSRRMHAVHTGPPCQRAADAMAYADAYIDRIVAAEATAFPSVTTRVAVRAKPDLSKDKHTCSEERAAVVAYVRGFAERYGRSGDERLKAALEDLALNIKTGVHLWPGDAIENDPP